MKGNILVLTNFIAGLHSFRKEVMKAIVDAGYQLYISVPDSNDDRVDYFKGIGAEIIKTDFNRRGMNPLADFKLMLNYRRLIKQLKPIAVLSYTIKPNVYGGIACRLTGTPLIANVTGLGDAIENGGWLQKLTVSLYRFEQARLHRCSSRMKQTRTSVLNIKSQIIMRLFYQVQALILSIIVFRSMHPMV